jgi:hypothetical protein
MITIHKFQFDPQGLSTTMKWPLQPLSVGLQNDEITLWMLVDDAQEERSVDIIVTPTGGEVRKDWTYCGTVQQGRFVWHVWIPSRQFGWAVL